MGETVGRRFVTKEFFVRPTMLVTMTLGCSLNRFSLLPSSACWEMAPIS
jgi:hypothetical protein